MIPKLSHPGCFGIVTDYSGGAYTLCDIGNNGGASSCQTVTLPEERPYPRFVAALDDGSLVITCENQHLLLHLPWPAE